MLDQKCREIFESKDLIAMRAFLERLIKDGNQDDVDTYRITPLMYACKFGNFSLVKTLLDAGVNTNKINIDGDSAVMYAVNNSNRTDGAEIVTTLIKHGVDIDSNINKKSEYPLLIAAKMDNQQCFKALLPYSAWCRHHIDKHGYSAVSYANKNNCKHELDKFFFRDNVKKRIQHFGSLLLKPITFPFKIILSICVYLLEMVGLIKSSKISTSRTPVGISMDSGSGSGAKITFDAPQQYDAEFEMFARDMKNHVESTFKKSEAVVARLNHDLKEAEAIVARLKTTPNDASQLEDAISKQETAKNTYIINNMTHEALLGYKKRFDNYNFFNNSHSYSKTNFFETSRKYIKDITPILAGLNTAFNSIALPESTNIDPASQRVALQFSPSLRSDNITSDLAMLSEKLNGLSLKKM